MPNIVVIVCVFFLWVWKGAADTKKWEFICFAKINKWINSCTWPGCVYLAETASFDPEETRKQCTCRRQRVGLWWLYLYSNRIVCVCVFLWTSTKAGDCPVQTVWHLMSFWSNLHSEMSVFNLQRSYISYNNINCLCCSLYRPGKTPV